MLKSLLLKIILLVSFFIFKYQVFAQHLSFNQIVKEDGLPSSFVYDIMEDDKGYIWFATAKGIVKYDGKNYKQYGIEEGFDDVGAYKIFKDQSNQICFVSINYKLFIVKNDQFVNVLPNKQISGIDCDENGRVWVLARSGELISLTNNKEEKKLKGVFEIAYFFKFLNKQRAIFISSASNEYFFKNYQLKKVLPKKYPGPTSRLFELSNNRVIIFDKGFVRLLDQTTFLSKTIYSFTNNEVYCCYEDTISKDLWFGTRNGLYLFKDGKLANSAQQKILDINTTSIFKSKDGTMWIGSYGAGIYHSTCLSKHYSKVDGLNTNIIQYLKKQQNQIYAIPNNSNYSTIENDEVIKKDHINLEDVCIDVFQDENEGIYLNQQSKNIFIDKNNAQLFNLPFNHFFVKAGKGKKIYSYQLNFEGIEIWENQFSKNMKLQHTQKILVINLLKLHKSVRSNNTKRFIFRVSKDESIFYLLVEKGLITYNRKDSSTYFDDIGGKVNEIVFLKDGKLALATNNKGICIKNKNKYIFYNTSNGMPSNNIDRIYLDSEYIWACTNNGLSRLTLNKQGIVSQIININSRNFLNSDEVNDMVIDQNKIYVATNKGVSVINKEKVNHLFSYSPPIYIDNFQINNKDTVIQDYHELNYMQNNIAISFHAISYSNEKMFYKYQLVGAEVSFNYTEETSVKYALLNPGIYNFVVYAKKENGEWNEQPAIINFTIQPPFWYKWWFILACILITITIITFIIIRKVKLSKQKYEIQRKIVEGELRALRLHMNPHFIFNILNSLQYFILKGKPLEANRYISDFSTLIRKIMVNSEKSFISLAEEKEFLKNYIELELFRMENKFEYQITTHGINDQNMRIPSLIIQPFVENAIKYGMNHVEKNGILKITFSKNEQIIHCTIEDNGPGRAYILKTQKNRSPLHKPTGILYTKERLNLLLNKKKDYDSVIITDLYTNQKASGTIVELKMPIL